MTDFEKQVLEDLAELKTNMRWVTGGDNRRGVLQELHDQVERHEQVLQRVKGLSAGLTCLLTMLHLGIEFLRVHFGR